MTDNAFPAIGHVYQADYRERTYRVAFDTDGKTRAGLKSRLRISTEIL